VGPIPVGINKFVLSADPPDIGQIPEGDVLGVTVVLVTCSYREKEFVRVGYYVNNEYEEPFDEEVGPPKPLDMSKVRRSILAEKPRVTRFPIAWGDDPEEKLEGGGDGGQENEGGDNGQRSVEGQMLEEAKSMGIGSLNGGDGDMMMEDALMGEGVAAE
jgi:histone chaperone ASF1